MILKNSLLNSLIENESANLFSYLENVWLSSRQRIHSPSDSPNYIYFPETAVISESRILEDGRAVEIAMIGNDGATNLIRLFADQEEAHIAAVLIQGLAHRIRTDVLKKQLFDNQSMQLLYWNFLQNYTMRMSAAIACISFHRIERRLARWLLTVQARTGKDRLNLTQEQMADALGAHRPTISNITVGLRDQEAIDYSRGVLTIKDRLTLQRIACEC